MKLKSNYRFARDFVKQQIMNFKKASNFILISLSAAILVGCAGLGSMQKHIDELGASASPDPLVMRGDKVKLDITGTFPEKYFPKKVIAEATPVLVYEGGESPYKMQGYQGEAAAGNYEVIPFATGKAFSYSDEIDFVPAMENSTLELRIYGKQGNKEATFDPLEIGVGVITTALLVQPDDMVVMSEDNFQRVKSYTQEAVINYEYNKSNVRYNEMKDEDIKDLQTFMEETIANERQSVTAVNISSYASPEGEISLNENLANERAESAGKSFMSVAKKAKMVFEDPEAIVVKTPKGEDWEGFKSLMNQSSIEDKELIIRVLEMETNKAQREEEIRNMSMTYKEIEKTILPQLRRSVITVNYEVQGFTDEELMNLSISNPDSLDVEELLKAATLFEDLNKKKQVYESCEAQFPQDYRGINNLGVVYYEMNMIAEATTYFEKAYNIDPASEVANNLGAVTRINGDRDAAMDYLNQSSESEANYNKGLIHIQNGDYDTAISSMGDANTVNVGLVKMLNGDNDGAKTALDNSDDDSAMADYIKAILSARMNDATAVLTNLNNAIAKDSSLADKAKKDLEFRDYSSQFNF